MKIDIDEHSGFCYGVIRAIDMAETLLESKEPVYILGDIVHNELEVERLRKKGLYTANHSILEEEEAGKILIRAHGEPPCTYEKAKTNNITLVDATCPVVIKLQQKVNKAYHESLLSGGIVIIYGKKGHAEVVGLMGHTENKALVVSSVEDLSNVNVLGPVYLFSQTTMEPDGFSEIETRIREIRCEQGTPDDIPLLVYNTICRHVSLRQEYLKKFAEQHDAIIFVAGIQSSNGKSLFKVCKRYNNCSYAVTEPKDIKPEWFNSANSVGICGATSTPKWLMESCGNYILDMVVNN